jgi:NADH dehydrogenase
MGSSRFSFVRDGSGADSARAVVLGCGFGGLAAARRLARAGLDVTIVDRENHHLFQPLLYQVATAGLSGVQIAAPIRHLFRGRANVGVLMAEALAVDTTTRHVLLDGGDRLEYDYLVVATGATHSYFGHPEWAGPAPGLKTLDDALVIRRRVLLAFERAERARDEAARRICLTLAVVGGGPTGVELAGTIAEIARETLANEFRHIYFLIGFRNRLGVMFDWAWSYWTYARNARIVTGVPEPGAPVETLHASPLPRDLASAQH